MAPIRRSRKNSVRSQANRRQSRKMTVKMNHVGHAICPESNIRRQTRRIHLRIP